MSKSISFVLLAAILSTSVFAGPHQACAQREDDVWDRFKADALGIEKGRTPFYFRAGFNMLRTDSSSSQVVLSDVSGPATLAVDSGPIDGSGVTVDGTNFPGVVVGCMLPWLNGHLSVETLLTLPFTVKFKTAGTLRDESIAPYALGRIPTGVPPLGEELGETKVLPPVVTLVYRFRLEKPLRPYVGTGMSYMITYDEKVTNPVLTAVDQPVLEVEDVFGVAFQGGVEYNFHGSWWVNFDVKFIAGLTPKATVSDIRVETPDLPVYDAARMGNASVDVTVDPWLYHLGVGFDF